MVLLIVFIKYKMGIYEVGLLNQMDTIHKFEYIDQYDSIEVREYVTNKIFLLNGKPFTLDDNFAFYSLDDKNNYVILEEGKMIEINF